MKEQSSFAKTISNTVSVLKKTFVPKVDTSYKFQKNYFSK